MDKQELAVRQFGGCAGCMENCPEESVYELTELRRVPTGEVLCAGCFDNETPSDIGITLDDKGCAVPAWSTLPTAADILAAEAARIAQEAYVRALEEARDACFARGSRMESAQARAASRLCAAAIKSLLDAERAESKGEKNDAG